MIVRLIYRLLSTMLAFAATIVVVVAMDVRGVVAFLLAGAAVGAIVWAVEHATGVDDWKRGLR